MYSLYSCWLHMVWNKHFQEKFTFNDFNDFGAHSLVIMDLNLYGKKHYVERF